MEESNLDLFGQCYRTTLGTTSRVLKRINMKQVLKEVLFEDRNTDPKLSDFESCIKCGTITGVRKDANVEFRPNYVEGAGQLCITCDHTRTALSYDDIDIGASTS